MANADEFKKLKSYIQTNGNENKLSNFVITAVRTLPIGEGLPENKIST
jgi:hypothetical protein